PVKAPAVTPPPKVVAQAVPPPPPVAAPPPPVVRAPPGLPQPSGYELERQRRAALARDAGQPGPVATQALPLPPPVVPPAPARAVIAPGILTARTVFDPLPIKALKPAEQTAVRATMDQARQALAASNGPLAEQLFGRVIEGDPGNVAGLLAEAHLGRGRARLLLQNVQPAKEDFDFVVDRRLGPNPMLARAAIERGRLLQAHDALGPAADSFDLAVTADPNNAEGHYERGMLLLRQGNMLSAREALEAAIAHKIDYAEAYAGLGDIYFTQAQFRQAAGAYDFALKVRGDLWLARYARARALYQDQQFEPALQGFQSLIDAPRPPQIGERYDAALYCGAGQALVGKAWTSRSRDDWVLAGLAFDAAGKASAPAAQISRWASLVNLHRKVDSLKVGRLLGGAVATQSGDHSREYMSPPSLDPADACVAYLAG
ncbi:MAG: hypothetical protein JWP35_134, partial [Caulobacter sp.]|nr:hypothetical protein [Caulobacter sp.]